MPATSDFDDRPRRPNDPDQPTESDGEDRVIGRPYSRVETEVLEILKRSDKPASLSDHVRRKAARARRERMEQTTWQAREAVRTAGPGTFLLACVGFALAAFFVRDASGLLANLFALASVVCLVWLIVQGVRRPGGSNPSNRRWRGRDMDIAPPADPPRWVQDLRDRFRK